MLASAVVMLALSIVLALSTSLCWHHCPHCAGVTTLVALASCAGDAVYAAWSTTLSVAKYIPAQRWWRRLQINCTTQAQQGQRGLCEEGTSASALRAIMPAWQGQQHQRNSASTPAQWGHQRQCNDDDNAHETWGQRGQHNKDDSTNATRATMPVQCWQYCQCN